MADRPMDLERAQCLVIKSKRLLASGEALNEYYLPVWQDTANALDKALLEINKLHAEKIELSNNNVSLRDRGSASIAILLGLITGLVVMYLWARSHCS